ncbi:MAG: DUF3226 domain-containing protein [Deltaproteobacteria bacterium]|nr:hypothetical protein [Candidatus Caldarchaeum sp.]MDW8002752.1 DUF3226 domain-containing protein [Deltaproteobacteria bacterium]
MAVQVNKTRVLVVEGRDEEMFFGAFVEYLGLQNVQILPIGGKKKLRRNLKALVSSPNFFKVVSLGIIIDANLDPKGAFQSVRDALRSVNLPAPDHPIIPAGKKPRVAVLILPEENKPGMLEDLCLRAIEQDPAMVCVKQYFQCLKQQGLSPPDNISKAKVQVFLASRRRAGLRLGEAAQAGYWPWDAKAFEQVKNFLDQIAK